MRDDGSSKCKAKEEPFHEKAFPKGLDRRPMANAICAICQLRIPAKYLVCITERTSRRVKGLTLADADSLLSSTDDDSAGRFA